VGNHKPFRDGRGLILPVVLVILLLLAMVGATFSLFTSAELGASEARANKFQTRLAAEAGLQRVLLMLREHRAETSLWWDNPDLRRAQIWPSAKEGETYDTRVTRTDSNDTAGGRTYETRWRYSIVAADMDDNTEQERRRVRYGIQDEAAKLNINWATPAELTSLFRAVVDPGLQIPVEELVDCLLDWREPGETPRPAGAKSDYYHQLNPPYSVGGAPLKTVEELLLIKNFSARIVYGEDYNRNGRLDPSEDDGSTTFPPDNADGKLDLGLLPFVTVYSMGQDRASDNKPRISINAKPEELAIILPQILETNLAEFIIEARKKGFVFKSPAQLAGDMKIKNETVTAPISPESFLVVMDRLTAVPRPPGTSPVMSMIAAPLPHVINVNTAPAPVLACLGLDDEQIQQVIGARRQLGDKEKISPAWLVNEGIMTPEELTKFTGLQLNALHIVTQTWQFTVESVGHGDHVGMMYRLQAIIEMQGQLPIVKYVRDISRLGPAWPLGLEEESREISGTTY
jgi:type II secretory pathway component PulK